MDTPVVFAYDPTRREIMVLSVVAALALAVLLLAVPTVVHAVPQGEWISTGPPIDVLTTGVSLRASVHRDHEDRSIVIARIGRS